MAAFHGFKSVALKPVKAGHRRDVSRPCQYRFFASDDSFQLVCGQLSFSLWIDHHANEQEGVSALISDHDQKRMIGDDSEWLNG